MKNESKPVSVYRASIPSHPTVVKTAIMAQRIVVVFFIGLEGCLNEKLLLDGLGRKQNQGLAYIWSFACRRRGGGSRMQPGIKTEESGDGEFGQAWI